MIKVTELGYIGIGVSDADAWRDYASQVIGMQVLDEGEADRYYLRMDQMHHRIVVHLNGSDDLEYVGWRVPSPVELEDMALQLEAQGVAVTEGTETECRERRVLGLLKLQDPGGNPTEIFCTPQVEADQPFHPGRPMWGRFVTRNQGLGHMILRQQDPRAAYRFYTRVLGMGGSIEYRLPAPGGVATPWFVHCNERQHSVAFGVPNMPKRINHLNLEYTNLDDLGRSHDIVRNRQLPVAIQLGKHANDQALSFYHQNPSGWLVELGWGARKVLDQEEYYPADVWGHRVETPGMGMDLEMNRVESIRPAAAGQARSAVAREAA